MKRTVTWFGRKVDLNSVHDDSFAMCGVLSAKWTGYWIASAYGCSGDGAMLQEAVTALEHKMLHVHTGCFVELTASLDGGHS